MARTMKKGLDREGGAANPERLAPYDEGFVRHVIRNWKDLGLTPVILKLLVDEGWLPESIDDCFGEHVGKDYADIKVTEWIERLEAKGYEFPDGKPVFMVLKEILAEAWCGYTDDGSCGVKMS